jgi:putative intracellular protease/amidase
MASHCNRSAKAAEKGSAVSKHILAVLSEWGYWGKERIGPLHTLDDAGYQVDFATPTGRRPVASTPSVVADYVDPPLEMVEILEDRVRQWGFHSSATA